MINLYKWDKNAYQVTLESASFYFCRKLPIAFRPTSRENIVIRDEQFGHEAQSFVDLLKSSLSYKPILLKKQEFQKFLKQTYQNALFEGVRRIGTDRLHLNEKLSEEKTYYVTDHKNNAR